MRSVLRREMADGKTISWWLGVARDDLSMRTTLYLLVPFNLLYRWGALLMDYIHFSSPDRWAREKARVYEQAYREGRAIGYRDACALDCWITKDLAGGEG